ncbi:hypothetical protein P7C70_g3142, partial [Phenoliferia sp. Uapishka_3]
MQHEASADSMFHPATGTTQLHSSIPEEKPLQIVLLLKGTKYIAPLPQPHVGRISIDGKGEDAVLRCVLSKAHGVQHPSSLERPGDRTVRWKREWVRPASLKPHQSPGFRVRKWVLDTSVGGQEGTEEEMLAAALVVASSGLEAVGLDGGPSTEASTPLPQSQSGTATPAVLEMDIDAPTSTAADGLGSGVVQAVATPQDSQTQTSRPPVPTPDVQLEDKPAPATEQTN